MRPGRIPALHARYSFPAFSLLSRRPLLPSRYTASISHYKIHDMILSNQVLSGSSAFGCPCFRAPGTIFCVHAGDLLRSDRNDCERADYAHTFRMSLSGLSFWRCTYYSMVHCFFRISHMPFPPYNMHFGTLS